MRNALFGILMATALAAPAWAQEAQETEVEARYRIQGERNQAAVERQEQREAMRAQRQTERAQQRMERVGTNGADVQHVIRRDRRGDWQQRTPREDVEARIARERAQRAYPEEMTENYRRAWDRNEANVARREDRQLRRQEAERHGRDYRRNRGGWNDGRGWNGGGRYWGDNRYGWDHGWRNDRRYDWRRHRYSNRGIFRPGPYYSPYRNYGYNRFSIGITLGRDYYSNRYWINDPWQYRLPQPYAGTRWVRYYNDVLLVDTFNGQVLDVIHDFFW